MPTLIDTPPMSALLTAEEFCRIPNPKDGSILELHDGKMIVMPPPKEAGVRIVWLVDGETRTVTVYAGDLHRVEHDEAATLTAADILPGFSMPIQQIFAV